jgi:regulatory protein
MKKYLDDTQALQKLQAYCAYQERCHLEVSRKLADLGVYGDRADAIMARLIEDNFLNEERFATTFARGKFRIKQWGKIRIRQELKARHVSDYAIKKALAAIDDLPDAASEKGIHSDMLKNILLSRLETYNGDEQKAAAFAIRRGFEAEKVWEMLTVLTAK